jgi:hypothetical protein
MYVIARQPGIEENAGPQITASTYSPESGYRAAAPVDDRVSFLRRTTSAADFAEDAEELANTTSLPATKHIRGGRR